MALSSQQMRVLLRENRHLVLEGNETAAELREALMFLYMHYDIECRLPDPGPPICWSIELADLAPRKAGRPRKIKDTDPL